MAGLGDCQLGGGEGFRLWKIYFLYGFILMYMYTFQDEIFQSSGYTETEEFR